MRGVLSLALTLALVAGPGIAQLLPFGGPLRSGGETPATAADSEQETGLRGFFATLLEPSPERPATGEPMLVRAYSDRFGVPCREYAQRVFVGDELVTATATVCRNADGAWILRE